MTRAHKSTRSAERAQPPSGGPSPFLLLDSALGPFIVPRFCHFQADALVKTGFPHIWPEIELMASIVGALPLGALFLDAGANIGLISLPMAKVLAPLGGSVVAWEPQRLLAYALAGAVSLNYLGNVEVHVEALGEDDTTVYMKEPDYTLVADYGQAETYRPSADAREGLIPVPCSPLDDWQLSPDFIKIDCEGAEEAIISGGARTIRRSLPYLWVEYWRPTDPDPRPRINSLRALAPLEGYRCFVLDGLNLFFSPPSRPLPSRISTLPEITNVL